LQAFDRVRNVRQSGDDDDGDVRPKPVRTQECVEREAVDDIREHQIEKDHPWAEPAPENTQRLHAIRRARDVEALEP